MKGGKCPVLLFLVILAMLVLPVGLLFVVVVDSKLRAAVEAVEVVVSYHGQNKRKWWFVGFYRVPFAP